MNRTEENMEHAERHENLELTEVDLKGALRKSQNWKSFGFSRILGALN